VSSSSKFVAAFLCLLLAGEASAACTVSATGVDFGAYDVFVTTPLDSTGTVTVTCDQAPPADIVVAIGPAGHPAASSRGRCGAPLRRTG
jgi:spore coat protein U-like protein